MCTKHLVDKTELEFVRHYHENSIKHFLQQILLLWDNTETASHKIIKKIIHKHFKIINDKDFNRYLDITGTNLDFLICNPRFTMSIEFYFI